MVRLNKTHIRFGTLERLHYLKRPDLISKLLDRAIAVYYPDIADGEDKYRQFYAQLCDRVAKLAAQWMAAGFCHGVLNTDNMSIAGESFDYGPYAFITTYDARFTAASFDYGGRYSYGNQPHICKFNLELLQEPLSLITERSPLEVELTQFDDLYQQYYQQLMLQKLGFEFDGSTIQRELFERTIGILRDTEIAYHGFFAELSQEFSPTWQDDSSSILSHASFAAQITEDWRKTYYKCLQQTSTEAIDVMGDRLNHNPQTALLRPQIESVWQSIGEANDWQPFNDLLRQLQR